MSDGSYGSWPCRNGLMEAQPRRNFDEVAIGGHFLGSFNSKSTSEAYSRLLGRLRNGCYALIDAISGWMPMMFMTRVRL
jgi:hypothetical protein